MTLYKFFVKNRNSNFCGVAKKVNLWYNFICVHCVNVNLHSEKLPFYSFLAYYLVLCYHDRVRICIKYMGYEKRMFI